MFTPADEPTQIALGEQVLSVFRSTGVQIVAEDLGTVPDFVRESLARAVMPGYKVFRWERHWHSPGQPFRDPPEYPAASVATSGTHDTEPMTVWWAQAPPAERQAVLDTPAVRSRLSEAEAQTRDRIAVVVNCGAKRVARGAVCLRCRSAHSANPGRVRLERSNQSASDGECPELDVAVALADRSDVERTRGDVGRATTQSVVGEVQTLKVKTTCPPCR